MLDIRFKASRRALVKSILNKPIQLANKFSGCHKKNTYDFFDLKRSNPNQ